MSEIAKKVKEIVVKRFNVNPFDVEGYTRLVDDLKANEEEQKQIIEDIEQAFSIRIMSVEANRLKTIDDIISCVEAQKGGFQY